MEMEEENSMAEPVRNDESLSAVRWPETPSHANAAPELPSRPLLPEQTAGRPLGEWPYSEMTEAAIARPSEHSTLHDAGEAVGSALGAVVNEAREFPARFQGRMGELKRRFQVISGRETAELKQRATEWSDETERKVAEASSEVRREVFHWQVRARLYARQEPFRFVAAVGIGTFAIGFLLRLWREE
jgi:ElaB/YqjD/DUF883 family membrane-anchored ribosome-binding protein